MTNTNIPNYPMSITTLLPPKPRYKPEEYASLKQAASEVIQILQSDDLDLEQFDALVGENMCQIRAIKIASCVTDVLHNIQQMEDEVRKDPQDIQLTSDQLFLVQCLLLKQVKEKKASPVDPDIIEERTDHELLAPRYNISKIFAAGLVKQLRKTLSAASISFLHECSPDDQRLDDDLELEKANCKFFPFHFVNDILMSYVERRRMPIAFRIEQKRADDAHGLKFTYLFRKDSNNTYISAPLSDQLEPVVVFEGVMRRPNTDQMPSKEELEYELVSIGPHDLVMMNSSVHCQGFPQRNSLPDDQKEAIKSKKFTFEAMAGKAFQNHKLNAEILGCSKDNRRLFFINHVFCSTIKKLFEADGGGNHENAYL